MGHLRPEQIVDVVDGVPSQSAARHLKGCEVCRRHVEELRATMMAASDVGVPEPSPVFWNQFSKRVRETVQADPRRFSFAWLHTWRWSQDPLSIVALAVLIIAAVVVMWGRRVSEPTSRAEAIAFVTDSATATGDPTIDLVADLADEIDWEATPDAGLRLRAGSAEKAVSDLNDGERRELRNLLEQELKRSGD